MPKPAPKATDAAAAASRHAARLVRELANPPDLFSGAKLEEAMLAQNIVLFKRTSAEMLKPQGVTHNYHHRFALVIPLVKAGRVHVDGTAYALEPGQAFLIFPHQFHHYLEIEGGDMTWLFITFELADPQALQPLRNSPRLLGAENTEFLRGLLKTYHEGAPGTERNFHLIVQVSELLRRLLLAREAESIAVDERPQDDPRGAILQAINAYVRANLDRPLTIGDLAKHTGYSVSHLRAVFRKEIGVSLGGYMRDSRLSSAAAMLSSRERESIESIAKACGFGSIFAFSRAFKKAMGRSPSVYAKFIQESAD